MSKRKSGLKSAELTAGMTMAVNFISQFIERIAANGGNPSLIHRLTLPINAEKLDSLAKHAVSQGCFPILRSEVERMVEQKVRKFWQDNGLPSPGCDQDLLDAYLENDKRFHWADVLEGHFDIPIRLWGDHEDEGSVPEVITQQIVGKPLKYPLVVWHQEEQYVVVDMRAGELTNNYAPTAGDILKDIEYLEIAPARYFDLEN